MKLPKIKTETTPGTLTDRSFLRFPVVETDLSVPFGLEIKFETIDRHIQGLITIEADARDVEKYHRGWTGTIGIYDKPITNDDAKSKTHKVICKSRYKLKSGRVRLRFLTVKQG